jgi:hypothetical protein
VKLRSEEESDDPMSSLLARVVHRAYTTHIGKTPGLAYRIGRFAYWRNPPQAFWGVRDVSFTSGSLLRRWKSRRDERVYFFT